MLKILSCFLATDILDRERGRGKARCLRSTPDVAPLGPARFLDASAKAAAPPPPPIQKVLSTRNISSQYDRAPHGVFVLTHGMGGAGAELEMVYCNATAAAMLSAAAPASDGANFGALAVDYAKLLAASEPQLLQDIRTHLERAAVGDPAGNLTLYLDATKYPPLQPHADSMAMAAAAAMNCGPSGDANTAACQRLPGPARGFPTTDNDVTIYPAISANGSSTPGAAAPEDRGRRWAGAIVEPIRLETEASQGAASGPDAHQGAADGGARSRFGGGSSRNSTEQARDNVRLAVKVTLQAAFVCSIGQMLFPTTAPTQSSPCILADDHRPEDAVKQGRVPDHATTAATAADTSAAGILGDGSISTSKVVTSTASKFIQAGECPARQQENSRVPGTAPFVLHSSSQADWPELQYAAGTVLALRLPAEMGPRSFGGGGAGPLAEAGTGPFEGKLAGLAREGVVLSGLTQITTAITADGSTVWYQNALSIGYFGHRTTSPPPSISRKPSWAPISLTGALTTAGRREDPTAAHGACWLHDFENGKAGLMGNVLHDLFCLEPKKLERLLLEVCGERRVWRGIVQVPVSCKPGSLSGIHSGSGPSATPEDVNKTSPPRPRPSQPSPPPQRPPQMPQQATPGGRQTVQSQQPDTRTTTLVVAPSSAPDLRMQLFALGISTGVADVSFTPAAGGSAQSMVVAAAATAEQSCSAYSDIGSTITAAVAAPASLTDTVDDAVTERHPCATATSTITVTAPATATDTSTTTVTAPATATDTVTVADDTAVAGAAAAGAASSSAAAPRLGNSRLSSGMFPCADSTETMASAVAAYGSRPFHQSTCDEDPLATSTWGLLVGTNENTPADFLAANAVQISRDNNITRFLSGRLSTAAGAMTSSVAADGPSSSSASAARSMPRRPPAPPMPSSSPPPPEQQHQRQHDPTADNAQVLHLPLPPLRLQQPAGCVSEKQGDGVGVSSTVTVVAPHLVAAVPTTTTGEYEPLSRVQSPLLLPSLPAAHLLAPWVPSSATASQSRPSHRSEPRKLFGIDTSVKQFLGTSTAAVLSGTLSSTTAGEALEVDGRQSARLDGGAGGGGGVGLIARTGASFTSATHRSPSLMSGTGTAAGWNPPARRAMSRSYADLRALAVRSATPAVAAASAASPPAGALSRVLAFASSLRHTPSAVQVALQRAATGGQLSISSPAPREPRQGPSPPAVRPPPRALHPPRGALSAITATIPAPRVPRGASASARPNVGEAGGTAAGVVAARATSAVITSTDNRSGSATGLPISGPHSTGVVGALNGHLPTANVGIGTTTAATGSPERLACAAATAFAGPCQRVAAAGQEAAADRVVDLCGSAAGRADPAGRSITPPSTRPAPPQRVPPALARLFPFAVRWMDEGGAGAGASSSAPHAGCCAVPAGARICAGSGTESGGLQQQAHAARHGVQRGPGVEEATTGSRSGRCRSRREAIVSRLLPDRRASSAALPASASSLESSARHFTGSAFRQHQRQHHKQPHQQHSLQEMLDAELGTQTHSHIGRGDDAGGGGGACGGAAGEGPSACAGGCGCAGGRACSRGGGVDENCCAAADGGGDGGSGPEVGHNSNRDNLLRSPQALGTRWHEVVASPVVDPVTGQEAILLAQTDVTAKVEAERHIAFVAEAEHRLLEQIFPRHVLTYMTEEDGAPASAGGVWPQQVQARQPKPPPHTRDITKLATWHDEVTLLFADIQGFTPMCKVLEPQVVMAFLNDLFTRFDSRLDEFGVYKVETIGDCYFVAGGLIHQDEYGMPAVRSRKSLSDPLHAEKVLMFAKAMLAAAAHVTLPTTGEPVKMRIGIHSGPVVSGVVGQRMPRFCLFGDTVNTASRMESTGVPGCIHASEAARNLLINEAWVPTGGIEVKGKGPMDTYIWAPPESESHQVLMLCRGLAACRSSSCGHSGGGGTVRGSSSGPERVGRQRRSHLRALLGSQHHRCRRPPLATATRCRCRSVGGGGGGGGSTSSLPASLRLLHSEDSGGGGDGDSSAGGCPFHHQRDDDSTRMRVVDTAAAAAAGALIVSSTEPSRAGGESLLLVHPPHGSSSLGCSSSRHSEDVSLMRLVELLMPKQHMRHHHVITTSSSAVRGRRRSDVAAMAAAAAAAAAVAAATNGHHVGRSSSPSSSSGQLAAAAGAASRS